MPRTSTQFKEIRGKSRQKIIDAAIALFAKQTYHNTSISDIAKAAGISKGLIYNYFETKEDILKGIVDYLMSFSEQMFQHVEKHKSPKEEMRTLIDQFFMFLEQQATLNRMMIPLALEIGGFDYINKEVEQKTKIYLRKMMRLLKEIGFNEPVMEAWILGALFDGISLDYAIIGNKLPVKRIQRYLYKKYKL